MKKLLSLFTFCLIFGLISNQKIHAQVSAGAGIAFGSDIEQIGIQGDILYRFSALSPVRISGGVIYYFPKDNLNFIELNLNGNYIFYEEFMFRSYALVGLNYARSKVTVGGSSFSESEPGLNLGVGAEYDFNRLLAFGELKYVVSEFNQPVFGIGLRYRF